MIRAATLLAVTIALMASARSFLPGGDGPIPASGVALGFGFLILAAVQTGNLFAALRLPRLTGYLITGLICGPDLSGLLTERMLDGMGSINGVAVGLIALSAGSELNLRQIRPRIRTIVLVGVIAIPFALFAQSILVFVTGPWLPFMQGMGLGQRIAISAVLAVTFATLSPSVALAILAETGSAGPVSESTLGVVVLGDIVIIVLFAVVHAMAAGVFGAPAGGMDPTRQVMIEVFGSMGVGAAVGGALALYMRRVQTKIAIFVVAVCFVAAQIGTRLHFDVLIICLTAGLMLENVFGVHGEILSVELGPATLPVFAVFFALAGAKLHMHDLQRLWPFALLFGSVRAAALFVGARIGTRIAKADAAVQKWMPFGMLPQAGVAVGIAVLVERHFPTWGPGAKALVLSVITINEMIGPVLLRWALVRAGEAGQRKDAVAGDH